MAVFGTAGIQNLPRNIADGIVRKTADTSTVAALSGQTPQRFGSTDIITFNDLPRAEYVGESAQKSSTTGTFGVVTATPKKVQVTMRVSQEVEWADADYQLGVLNELASQGGAALARALDLGLYYRINPLTGTAVSSITNYLNQTTSRVEISTATSTTPDRVIESAVGMITAKKYAVNGIAFDPTYAWTLSTARYPDGRKIFPELGFGTNITAFNGLNAATSSTVSATSDGGADNKVKAIVGDFQGGIKWAVQKNIPLTVIRYGDPDGQGDLARQNQLALRLEVVYGWYVFTDRFAIVEDVTANT